ncbi:MAG: RNA polymerase sigma factor [Archangiaceae bacterium]|nr:RNA polymerase sigma factor [Archangiaceae bacterium]
MVMPRADDATAEVHRLYRETVGPLRSTLKRLTWSQADVDDMLQDVFVAALDRPLGLVKAQSPRAWLYGIAINIASERNRRHKLRRFFGLDAVPEPVAPDSPHAALEQREAQALVQASLEALSAKKRAVLVLYELEGFSGEEIALAVGAPVKTVWTRLYHARRELNFELEKRVGKPT